MIANQVAGLLAATTPPTPVGDYESIQTVTVGSGGSSSINFTSIPSTYKHLQIRGLARAINGGGSNTWGLDAIFNSDSGSAYTSSHGLYGTGATAAATASATSQTKGTITNYPMSSATTNAFGIFVADILDYTNTNKYKTLRGLGGYDGNDTNGIVILRSFAWMNTSAITSITLTGGSGADFAQYSTFALYGVK